MDGRMVSRLRGIFLVWALCSTGVSIAAVLTSDAGSDAGRAALATALAMLACYWLLGWLRGGFAPGLELIEWLIVAAPGLVLDSVADSGAYFGALLFRSFYGSARELRVRLVLAQLVPGVRLAAGLSGLGPPDPAQLGAAIVFGLVAPLLMRMLRGIAEQNDRLLARERLQLAGSERLAAAADRDALSEVAVQTAAGLADTTGDRRVLFALYDDGDRLPRATGSHGPLRVVAGHGTPPADVGRLVHLDALRPALRARLAPPHPAYLTPEEIGEIRDVTGAPHASGGLLVVPVSAGGRYRGVFGISGDARLPADTRTSLATWGSRVAEALYRLDLNAELTFRAYHDPLTALANRALLEERLEEALLRPDAAARPGRAPAVPGSVALLLLDLDGFKQVNDVHGHPAGDELLRRIAGRLRSCVRDTDTVARLGGDEFAILLTGVDDQTLVEATADRVVASIGAPVEVEGQAVTVGVSVGVAVAEPGGPVGVRDLIRAGDQAMYHRKSTRAGGWTRYEAPLTA
ncbi:diguanylate cyclase domain-containing protein [Cryptosporangium sp. NPDC051539]|uniref:diguanylate cyclase domain-containing protein n=1 Tax=Cryptosporangium sp. NPDC051539 TaxID=3363962 RepID=UPI0037A6CCD6